MPETCSRGRTDCAWVRMSVRDQHGIRQSYWVCTVCNAGRWTTAPAPTLGERAPTRE